MDLFNVLNDADPLEDVNVTLGTTVETDPKVARSRIDPFTYYTDTEFKLHYRLRKPTVRVLIDLLEDKLRRPTQRSNALSTATQVFLALRYAASGDFLRTDADLHGVAISTVSTVVHPVFAAIASMRPSFVKFPEPEEFATIERGFYGMKGVPGVLGAVDGTHIPILKPTTEDAERYRNRKGWLSINTQLMCDHKTKVRNVVASWPGSAHDSRIFNESTLKTKLEQLPQQYHILGDRGYACTPYLLTPFPSPEGRPQSRFNGAHSSTRMTIERLNGTLKRRFPCLERKLRFTPEKCAVIIVACCVLHNLALMENDPWDDEFDPRFGLDTEDVADGSGDTVTGSAKRAAIVQEYFA